MVGTGPGCLEWLSIRFKNHIGEIFARKKSQSKETDSKNGLPYTDSPMKVDAGNQSEEESFGPLFNNIRVSRPKAIQPNGLIREALIFYS